MSALTLNRWYITAQGSGNAAIAAAKESIVNGLVIPAFDDSVVQQFADCCYAGKYTPEQADAHEVRMTVIANIDGVGKVVTAVEAHVTGWPAEHRDVDDRNDVMCLTASAWYRQAVHEVTAVALDLHGQTIEQHRRVLAPLSRLTGGPGFSHENLHSHLLKHSTTYSRRCSTDEETATFWKDFDSPGPAGLSCPGHWLDAIVAE